MAHAALTERQAEIKDHIETLGIDPHDIPVGQLAEELRLTPNTVYNHIRKMRDHGHLPKRGRKRRPGRGPREIIPSDKPAPSPATNSDTLEAHLERELDSAIDRLKALTAGIEQQTAEKEQVSTRQARLEKAKHELVPAS